MLGGTVGPRGPNWALVGMVREPVSRYLSWFFYYAEPDQRISVDVYARRGLGANGAGRQCRSSCAALMSAAVTAGGKLFDVLFAPCRRVGEGIRGQKRGRGEGVRLKSRMGVRRPPLPISVTFPHS